MHLTVESTLPIQQMLYQSTLFLMMNYCFVGQSNYILLKCISCCGETNLLKVPALFHVDIDDHDLICVMHLCQCSTTLIASWS